MKKVISIVLIILAIIMFYLSYQMQGLPPAITGVGFVLIAIVFIADKD